MRSGLLAANSGFVMGLVAFVMGLVAFVMGFVVGLVAFVVGLVGTTTPGFRSVKPLDRSPDASLFRQRWIGSA